MPQRRSRLGGPTRKEHFYFQGPNNDPVVFDRVLTVRFCERPEMRKFVVDDPDSASEWISCKQRSSKTIVGSSYSMLRKTMSHKLSKLSSRRSLRAAVGRAISLATLLGMPGRVMAFHMHKDAIARFIVDTGCGKDMVGANAFSKDYLRKNSWERNNPLMMQTANGVLKLKKEVDFRLDALRHDVSAIIGGDTPNLLSVGYRCMELGFAFHWEPMSLPYFVLPDGKTEIDLCVDSYVPYLDDDTGDMARNSGAHAALSLEEMKTIAGCRVVDGDADSDDDFSLSSDRSRGIARDENADFARARIWPRISTIWPT